MKILMTAGGTEEAIDGVRRLANTSTGRTGFVLARHFIEMNANVFLLRSRSACSGDTNIPGEDFLSFADLENLLHRCLETEKWDVLVHLAAVSDYSIASVEIDGRIFPAPLPSKIPSGSEILLKLQPNPKLIDRVRHWSLNTDIMVIAFKLTDESEPSARREAVLQLMDRAGPDLVVHNDISEVSPNTHSADIFSREVWIRHTRSREELAEALWNRILHSLRNKVDTAALSKEAKK